MKVPNMYSHTWKHEQTLDALMGKAGTARPGKTHIKSRRDIQTYPSHKPSGRLEPFCNDAVQMAPASDTNNPFR
jgi:hypothetical protein